jgi:phosphate/sulfate permease
MDIYLGAIVVLGALAVSDLIVGVSNDAVNFLNSSVGSKVAPRAVIFIIASLGILAGVTFSSGMMEVARKGIFHPKYFTMPELMVMFLAVMLTDIFLLDLYNTFGLPTSTTVSIVFELLGAAVAVSVIKIMVSGQSFSTLVDYINTGKALAIIFGILISVVIAFVVGALLQFISRLLFTFDYVKRLKRYGGIWGGAAMAMIVYFILIKGAKGASFITDETLEWITTHNATILLASFAVCAVIFQLLLFFSRINILKIIILVGTFALAMAFAANDLVNFIGVPLAGLSSYMAANAAGADGLTQAMTALEQPVRSQTGLLLIAGIIMVITLWISRKARTVTQTEVSLGRQDEGVERFGSSSLSRSLVRMSSSLITGVRKLVPGRWQVMVARRFDDRLYRPASGIDGERPSFDLLRASVNLMVASALISFATSLKLPLSTTYVTFMVAMGTSLSDRAWGRDSAVYRITGVLTVIGGWFITALMAFTVSSIFAVVIYHWQAVGVLVILAVVVLLVLRNHRVHRDRAVADEALEIFNLRKITDTQQAIVISFEHAGIFLNEVKGAVEESLNGLFSLDLQRLKGRKKESKKIQNWANILVANIYKILRSMPSEEIEDTQRYTYTISTLQEIAESHRDIAMRSYLHIANNHKGLLSTQIEELGQIRDCVLEILDKTSEAFMQKEFRDFESITAVRSRLKKLAVDYNRNQIQRVRQQTSKTRLSILFYGIVWDLEKIADQTINLLNIFQHTLKVNDRREKAGMVQNPDIP